MAGFAGELGDQVSAVFRRLSFGQKIVSLLVVVGAIAGLVGIINLASKPDFVPLFSNLPQEEAGKVVNWLTENKIEYELESGGSRVLVPREHVYDARIKLAQEGMPSARNTGYEIFDETNLGMSEFVQKLNFRRALEGELSRTIEELDEVDIARVHIVIPEQALFREKENPPTASITLKLRGTLSQNQIQGVSHLIASAVEGLSTENITIIDSKGNILSRLQDSDPLMAMTATQMELRNSVENQLSSKVETMLSQLLGPDKAIVRVSAEMDFTRSEVTKEEYDPEQSAVRSEEVIETQQTSNEQQQVNPADPNLPPLGANDNVTETNNITNYEISKTISHTVSQTGGIQRISASVMIDGTYMAVDGADNPEYRERTPQEMQQITQAVRSALGIDDTRGDELSVINVPFQAPEPEQMPNSFFYYFQSHWLDLIRSLFFAAAVIGALVYIRNLLQRSSDAARVMMEKRMATLPGGSLALPGAEGAGGEPLALPDIDSELPEDVLEAQQLQQRISDFAVEQPETAARLLKTWLSAGGD